MATGTYQNSANTDPTKAVLNESSAGVKALQTSLNTKNAGVAGYTPLLVDGKYGPLTQAAAGFKAAAAPGGESTADPLNGVRRYTGNNSNASTSASDEFYNNLNVAAPNEQQIRSQMLSDVQGQIDAVNNIYAGLVTTENRAGVDRLGRTRSTSARSGTLGSDFGNADLAATDQYNAEKVQALRDEQASKIAGILDKVNTRADERLKADKDQYFKNAEAKLSYMKTKETDARADLKTLAETGVDLEKLSQQEYNALIEQTGYDDATLKAQFILNRPKADILDKQVVGSKYYQISKDPITGKVKSESFDLGFTPPQGYKPQQLDDGTLILVPEKIDPTKPISSQVLMYGKQGQFAKPKTTDEEDPAIVKELQDAQAAIEGGASADAVRRRFLDKYPKKGDVFLKYTKQEY